METDGVPLTADQARSALADTEHVRASTTALSATPWPTWFTIVLTLYAAGLPIAYGGYVADADWLLPRPAWLALTLGSTAVYVALFGVAARAWRAKTGVAIRLDVLPKRATVPLMVGLPSALLAAAFAFRATGWPGWLIAASLANAVVCVAFHLVFVRLHRKAT
jgi:hypothetical protein